MARSDRSRVVFVHTDAGQPDEPGWADGGTYLVTMKIVQDRDAFAALPDDAARDAVIGRTKDGTRLDLQGQGIDAHREPAAAPDGLPAGSHVRKAGPRGVHDDTAIFRRGLPFLEVAGGRVQVGLQFASFQANPAQFDVIFNDWMMNPRFPARGDGAPAGPDALLAGGGPAGAFTQILHAGLFFVPPYHPDGLAAALSDPASHRRTHGRLVVSKAVVDPANPGSRFERGGFVFRVQDDSGVAIPGAEFATDSTGRGVCPVELEMGRSYVLVEASTPHPSIDALSTTSFTMQKPNEHLRVVNQLTQPGGYGTR